MDDRHLPGRGVSSLPGRPSEPGNLADILERVLDKGIVIAGDIQINLLDIELLTIKLRLLIASVDRAREMGINWWEGDSSASEPRLGRLLREPVATGESGTARAAGAAGSAGSAAGTTGTASEFRGGGRRRAQTVGRQTRPGGAGAGSGRGRCRYCATLSSTRPCRGQQDGRTALRQTAGGEDQARRLRRRPRATCCGPTACCGPATLTHPIWRASSRGGDRASPRKGDLAVLVSRVPRAEFGPGAAAAQPQ